MKLFPMLYLSASKKLLFLMTIALAMSFLWLHGTKHIPGPRKSHPVKHALAVKPKSPWKRTTVLVTEYLVKNNQDYPGRHCPVYSGRTASGVYVRVGMAAADWSVFPKGTTFNVRGYGKAIVTDTGGMIVGHHIDLASNSCRKALEWGARTLAVAYEEPK